MNSKAKVFIGTICNNYIVLMLLVLPLYTGGSYYLLGDTKYYLFFCLTMGFVLLWLGYRMISYIGKGTLGQMQWSIVDIAMLSYGACALLSALASPYRRTAWTGYAEWYMGALTQLLLVGIYFFVSREYTVKNAYPIRAGELGLALVVLIAFLQRFGVDILGLHQPFHLLDWESSHMLSTIGNINWFCGYLSVMLPWPVVGMFYSTRRTKKMVYYILSVSALTLTLTQGSDIGILLVIACLGLGVLYGMKRPEIFHRTMMLAAGVCILCPVMGHVMSFLGTWNMLAVDGFLSGQVKKPFWWVLAALLLVICLIQSKLPEKAVVWFDRFLLMGGILFALCFVAVYLYRIPEGGAWGSGRGGLWKAAWYGFCEAEPIRKVIGFGPDCYAEYIYSSPTLANYIQMEGRWADSVFANAHNEWLNMLINGGVIGLLAYISVFVCAGKRYRGMMLGVMVLVLYGINSLFSFQQVMSTPFLFLTLGICESRYRADANS